MNSKLSVLALLVVLYVAYVTSAKTSGKFEADGRQCTWKELGSNNSHDR